MILSAFFRKCGILGKLKDKEFFRRRGLPLIGAILVVFVSLMVLYCGENVGLSDNGDFRRVLLMNNIEYKDDTDRYYLFKEDYKMHLKAEDSLGDAIASAWATNENEEIYKSPHFLFIRVSKVLNVLGNSVFGETLSDYNIFYLAILYIIMLAIAGYCIFDFFAENKLRVQLAVMAVFIFVFCDAGYLLYFNSFYGEPLQYVSLMMLIALGMLIYKRPSVPKVVGFFIVLYFFAGSKLANIPYSLMVALLAILMVIMRKDKLYKVGVIVSVVLCIANIVSLYAQVPDWMDEDTTYQSVFLGLLKNSPTPEKDLEELGVDTKYAVLAGTHAYMDADEYPIDIKTEEFHDDFYKKVNKFDIAFFYLRHPVRFVGELNQAIENSAYIRPPSVGNSIDTPMEMTDRYSGWSNTRVALRFLYEPWFVYVLFLSITAYMVFMNIFYIHNHKVESPERKYMICALDVLIIGLWINLVLPIICNGEADIAKHMFLFTNCIDILFAISVVALVSVPVKRSGIIAIAVAIFTGLFYIRIPGRTVILGELNGEPVRWERVKKFDDGTWLLVTKDCVGYMPYDETSNMWETSDVREWLNTDFIAEFSQEDRERIVRTTNKNMLPFSQRSNAIEGNHAHYWNFTPSLVYDMGETAYYNHTEDWVFMPTLTMLNEISVPEDYWVMCPYTSNDYMARYMADDGFILHTDVKNEKGVRAVIRIKE